MEKYELEQRYEDEEIDLVEIFKTLIKEKLLISIVTVIFTISAVGFSFYNNSKPKNYTAVITLNNNILNFLVAENTMFIDNNYSNAYINRINSLGKVQEINSYLLLNNTLNLNLKTNGNLLLSKIDAESKTLNISGIQKDFKDIIKDKNIYTVTGNTFDKSLNDVENNLKNKIIILNTNINKIFNKNLNKEIEKITENFKIITKESEIINQKINISTEKYHFTLSSDDTLEDLSLINPILAIEFTENKDKLKTTYTDLSILSSLSNLGENENILTLSLDSITFDKQKFDTKLIIAIGFIVGLFVGMFFAVIKAPLKNILLEIKKEK